jgi:gliding motility-associated-like protein
MNKFLLSGIFLFVLSIVGRTQNNDCAGAISLTPSADNTCSPTAGDVAGMTQSQVGCVGTANDDVWYKFVATQTAHDVSVTGNGTFDAVLQVFSGTCGGTSLACVDNTMGGGSESTSLTGLTIGNTYWIRVYDYYSGFPTNTTFSICVTTPPVAPPCGSSPAAGNSCDIATPICDLNGYCGNTSASYTVDTWPQLTTAFCGSIENNSFLSFVAASTTVSLNVWETSTVNNGGIQIMVFSAATCGSGPVTSYLCWNLTYFSPGPNLITIPGLTIGTSYYIMIDGYAGDNCAYTIGVPDGGGGLLIPVNVTPDVAEICLGSSIGLTAANGNGVYTWDPNTDLNTLSGANVIATPTTLGMHNYVVNSATGNPMCPGTASATASINVVAPPTATSGGSQTICSNGTALVSGANATDGTILWTHNGLGTLSNATTLTPTYNAVAGDAGSTVTLTMTVTSNNTCGGTATATYMVNVSNGSSITLSSAAGTDAQTLCINTALTSIEYTVGGSATGATVSGLPAGVSGSFSGGVFTISGTPTASGTFNYTVTTTGGCAPDATANGTIIVSPLSTIALSSAAGTDAQTLCINTALTSIEYTVGGSATGATVSGLPAGVSGSFSGGVFTISGTPTASGTFNYTVTTTGGCAPDATANGTIIVSPLSIITLSSAAGTDAQTLCINTALTSIEYTVGGSASGATVSGLPAGVSGSFSGGVFTISGTPTASGTFNYTVTTTGGCAPDATANGTIIVSPLSTIALSSTAGTDAQTLCINTALTSIEYTVGGSATGATVSGLPAGVSGSFSGGVFTISGTPTASGTFNYTVTTTGGCAPDATANGSIIVSPLSIITLSSAAGTDAQTLCINTALTSIEYTVGGSATGATVSGLPAGVSGSFSGGVFTISGTPTASGTFNYTVTTTGGCAPDATANGTIIVSPLSTIALSSAAGTDAQTLCINTALTSIEYTVGGSATGATVSGLPAGVSGSFSGGVFTISGTPTASGTFNYIVTTTGGCAPDATANGTIIVSPLSIITLSSAAGTDAQTLCINTALTSIEYTVGGSATGATVSGLPAGVSGSFSGGVFTISGTPTASGTFNYTVTTTGGCAPDATANGSIVVSALPTFTLSKTDPSVCNGNNGVITISGLVSNTSHDISYNDDAVLTGPITLSSDGAGVITITGLNAGTYDNFTVLNNLTGCSNTSAGGVTLNNPGAPILDDIIDQTFCDGGFTLPVITGSGVTANAGYFSATGRGGVNYPVGTNITSSMTIFINDFNGTCTDEQSFSITINTTPVADAPSGVTACDSYTLPTLTVGNYFTGSNGTGTALNAGDVITSSQTIYVYAETGTTPNCTDENSFTVTINTTPVADAPSNVTACDSYTLPALTVGNYFTGSNGTGMAMNAGDVITSSQTIYVYAETGTTPNCTDENSFTVTINTTPVADAPSNVTACDSYTLPALTVGNYFTGSNGTGTALNSGDVITSSQTIYVYAETGTTPNCTDENSFTVTINTTPVADAPSNVTVCDSYVLPALTVGNYFTGSNGTGMALSAGNVITSSQTIYVYAETGTTPNCTNENSFTLTINTTPVADAPSNVTACDSYTLPALTVGNYFTGSNGTGTAMSAGDVITSSQTIYVYAETGTTPNCTNENSFTVTINTTPVADAPSNVTVCDSYVLPALTVGNYFTGSNGTGMALSVGDVITSSQTIYVYAETGTTPNCTDENSFIVTINTTPVADAPSNVTTCVSYTLPALTVGNYFTGSNGTGTALNAGDVITSSQTIYVFAESGTSPNCTDENSFVVSINATINADAPSNVTACDSYVLPVLTVGNYFTGSTGTGTALNAGDVITSSQTIYVYAESGTIPNCTDENSFVVTINNSPSVDVLSNITICDSYVLPTLSVGNYFTGSNGTGIALNAGDIITSTQTIYIYAETGTTPNCTDESSFIVSINTTPVADSPSNVTACDSYVLPTLTTGNYFTGSNGTGTALNAGDVITSSQTLYVFAETGTTPNCTDENSFSVTINTTPVADAPSNVTACDSYALPTLTAGNYFTGSNGTGTAMSAGDVITSSQTIYVFAETGTTPNCTDENSFSVTINTTPVADSPSNVTACDSYVLPALVVGNYFTGSNGTGTALSAGEVITSSQTIYVYAETGTVPNCSDENSFNVTINATPTVDVLSDVSACGNYTLPALTVGNYFTGSNGTGTALNAGDVISNTQTVYIFAETGTVPNCFDESSFTITINASPIVDVLSDVSACDFYLLPTLNEGTYYTNSGGSGSVLAEGSLVYSTQTIYIYAETGTTPNCSDESSFVLTVNQTEDATFDMQDFCEGAANQVEILGVQGGTFSFALPTPLDGAQINSLTGELTECTGGQAYIVEYTSPGACPSTHTMSVYVNAYPEAPICSADQTYCKTDEIQMMEATPASKGEMKWYSDSYGNDYIGTGETLMPFEYTYDYYVTEISTGCEGPATKISIVINDCDVTIPTAFTPDNDGKNDEWVIEDLDATYPNNIVRVYNRWGNIVYETPQGQYNNNSWEGKYNGEELPVGSYYFIIDIQDGNKESLSGTVSILRNK